MKINARLLQKVLVTNDWKIKDLAKKSNLSRSTISRAIHGADVHPSTISRIYKAIDVDVDELIDWGD